MVLATFARRLEPTPEALLEAFRGGAVGALSRAISWAENGHDDVDSVLDALFPAIGQAWRTGFTGPPGAGKSTLVDALVGRYAGDRRSTALLAVDPSSPFSGGALLGDRIRMNQRVLDQGVFVRSMASRGSLGGLARASETACDLLDAFGFQEILVETVGVGQAEVDIAAATDTTVVVLTPASGDGIQAMKAGLMEVADLYVINKADLGPAAALAGEIEAMLDLRDPSRPRPPVLTCSALKGKGLAELVEALDRIRLRDRDSGAMQGRRQRRALSRVRRRIGETLRHRLWTEHGWEQLARQALADGKRPDRVAFDLLQNWWESGPFGQPAPANPAQKPASSPGPSRKQGNG
ncbi:MAG: methylmalonyl Co-A mutase-associated GTPase MeaB [Planctomycetota bacterium]|nr:MAG: methylmalonyl Co-A mutase-associated GTPase MeaB [Planctomycetota bacterium]